MVNGFYYLCLYLFVVCFAFWGGDAVTLEPRVCLMFESLISKGITFMRAYVFYFDLYLFYFSGLSRHSSLLGLGLIHLGMWPWHDVHVAMSEGSLEPPTIGALGLMTLRLWSEGLGA